MTRAGTIKAILTFSHSLGLTTRYKDRKNFPVLFQPDLDRPGRYKFRGYHSLHWVPIALLEKTHHDLVIAFLKREQSGYDPRG